MNQKWNNSHYYPQQWGSQYESVVNVLPHLIPPRSLALLQTSDINTDTINQQWKAETSQQCNFITNTESRISKLMNKELNYRQQTANQLHTQSNNCTEMTFKSHSRSSDMAQFATVHTIFHYCSMITMAASYIISHIKPHSNQNLWNLYVPTVFNASIGATT